MVSHNPEIQLSLQRNDILMTSFKAWEEEDGKFLTMVKYKWKQPFTGLEWVQTNEC